MLLILVLRFVLVEFRSYIALIFIAFDIILCDTVTVFIPHLVFSGLLRVVFCMLSY